MNEAAFQLVGLHDFGAFCKRREGATTVRTLLAFSWVRQDDGVVAGTVVADAFCHSMVRSLVGALVPVGDGRRDPDWPADVLGEGRRDSGVLVMAPHGLSLEEVDYPPDADLGSRAREARAVRSL
jgi:tRNA pseudouridine38-40 synthase